MKACGGLPGRVLPGYFAVFGGEVLFDKLERHLLLGLEIEWGTCHISFFVSKFNKPCFLRSGYLKKAIGLLDGIGNAAHQG